MGINAGPGTFSPGDRMVMGVRVKGDGGVSYYAMGDFANAVGTRIRCKLLDHKGTAAAEIASVQEFTVPAGTSQITYYLAANGGTGTVWWGQPFLTNLTKLGL